jgi:hypothetical protein
LIVYAIIDERTSPDHPLGDVIETFIRRQDAERFIEDVRGDEPEVASKAADRGAGAGGGRAELAPSVPLQGDDPDEESDDDSHRDRLWQPVGACDREEDEARDNNE